MLTAALLGAVLVAIFGTERLGWLGFFLGGVFGAVLALSSIWLITLVWAVAEALVFGWTHEDDSRRMVAPSLKFYLEWWLTGQLTI